MGVNQHSTLSWRDRHSWTPQRVLSGHAQSARLKGLFLKLATVLTLVCISGSNALADCAPANPGAGGTVTCSGDGYVAPANTPLTVNVLTNATVQGAGNPGVQISGTGDSTLNNAGVIGSNTGTAVEFDGVTGFTKTLNNNVTLNNNFVGTGDGTIVILQNGNFNGGITITGNGQNLITITANHNINGPVNISGVANTIDNAGIFNQGLSITGDGVNSITNHAGGQINQTFSITGDATTTIDNSGTINNGISLNGNGSNTITNEAGATINQNIVSVGSARDVITNNGLINNNVILNDGDDVYTNTGTQNGVVDMGPGADMFSMLGGRINNQVLLGTGNDDGTISGGVITQTVFAGDGADFVLWDGGNIGGLDMGADDDVAVFRNLTPDNLRSGLRVDGGLGSDRLTWDNTV